MSVGWAQRFIVPTNCDSTTLREMAGTIKRCAHMDHSFRNYFQRCVKIRTALGHETVQAPAWYRYA